MQNYVVNLQAPPPSGFRCTKAAQSVDLPLDQKLVHHMEIKADVETDYNVGLIIGASGSGKTTMAKEIFGPACFEEMLDLSKPIIDQFPTTMSYEECVSTLNGIGLSQVPSWVKPAGSLSNGQRARAEAALQMSSSRPFVVIDEFTSVVDRNVAKVMAHCVQKYARKMNKKIVLVSCHYDVFDWLNPDWVIDCNKETYTDRRRLRCHFTRTEQIEFQIAECPRQTWKNFSKYHYLSDRLPGGHIETFGVFHQGRQIGFQCFANYVPHRKGTKKIMHSNRTVIHPDYVGFGLGIKVIDITSSHMKALGYDVQAKFSAMPVYYAMSKNKNWKLSAVSNNLQAAQFVQGGNMTRSAGFRQKTRTFSFKYVGE